MNEVSGKAWDSKLFKRIIGIAKPHNKLLFYGLTITIILAILSPIKPFIIGKLIGEYVKAGDEKSLLYGTLLVVLLLLIESFLLIIISYLSSDLGQRVVKDLRDQLFRHITRLRLRFFDQNPIGMLVTRSVSDMETVAEIFSQGILVIIGDLLKLSGVLIFMFYINWRLALVVLIPVPLLIISTNIFKKAIKSSFQQVRKQISLLNSFVQEHITGMNIVQIFSREDIESDKFSLINKEHKKAHIRSIMAYSIFFPVVEFLSAMSIAFLVLYSIWSVSFMQVDYVTVSTQMLSFILYVHMLFRPIRMLADRFNTLQMGMVGSSRVFDLLDKKEIIIQKNQISDLNFRGDIVFKNVNFSYDSKQNVFEDLNFEVKAGETVAIVGPTGAGKSSVINLLSRFYEFQKGSITIDGVDIRDFKIELLRKQIGVVLQDVFLYNSTILDNITMGNSSISLDRVIKSAKKVGIHSFINSLPGGYKFEVKERGGVLSAGQRQLISFLRAFVYEPQLLVLDEATSSIDTVSEELIQKATSELTKGRTSIIIAHRLSTIKKADNILVMKNGKVIEMGSHNELIKSNGHYLDLYKKQFLKENRRTIY
tara:strand:+ start:10622 stop:12403 length:1782 start_codon:yes stop_codon:yes gene_type:complete